MPGRSRIRAGDGLVHQAATDLNQMMSLGKRRFVSTVCTIVSSDMAGIEPQFSLLCRVSKPTASFVFFLLHSWLHSVPDRQIVAEERFDGEIVTRDSLKMSRYISPAVCETVGGWRLGKSPTSLVSHGPSSFIFNAGFSTGFVVEGLEETVFGVETTSRGTATWGEVHDVPLVLAYLWEVDVDIWTNARLNAALENVGYDVLHTCCGKGVVGVWWVVQSGTISQVIKLKVGSV